MGDWEGARQGAGGRALPGDAGPAAGAKESELGLGYLTKDPNRAEKAQDLMWALMNSNAFLFNR